MICYSALVNMSIIIKKSNPYSYLNNQASISEMLKEAIMVLFLPVICSDEEEAPAQLELFVKKKSSFK